MGKVSEPIKLLCHNLQVGRREWKDASTSLPNRSIHSHVGHHHACATNNFHACSQPTFRVLCPDSAHRVAAGLAQIQAALGDEVPCVEQILHLLAHIRHLLRRLCSSMIKGLRSRVTMAPGCNFMKMLFLSHTCWFWQVASGTYAVHAPAMRLYQTFFRYASSSRLMASGRAPRAPPGPGAPCCAWLCMGWPEASRPRSRRMSVRMVCGHEGHERRL